MIAETEMSLLMSGKIFYKREISVMKNDLNNDDKKAKRMIIFLLLAFYIVGVIIGAVLFSYKGGSGGIMIERNAFPESFISHGNNGKSTDGITVYGVSSVLIPAGETAVPVDFCNPSENEGMYYLSFELGIYTDGKDEAEILYRSGLVEPGEHIYGITLSHALEAGEYKGVLHVQPYRMDKERTLTNNADMEIGIIVK